MRAVQGSAIEGAKICAKHRCIRWHALGRGGDVDLQIATSNIELFLWYVIKCLGN